MELILIAEFRKSLVEAQAWNATLVCTSWAKALRRLPLQPIKQLWKMTAQTDVLVLADPKLPLKHIQRYLVMPQSRAVIYLPGFPLQLNQISITTSKALRTDQIYDSLEFSRFRWSCSSWLNWTLAYSQRRVKEPTCFQHLVTPPVIVDGLELTIHNLKEPVELEVTMQECKQPSQRIEFYQEFIAYSETLLTLSDFVDCFIIEGSFDRAQLYQNSTCFADWSAAKGKSAWRLNGYKPVENTYLFKFPDNGFVNFNKLRATLKLVNLVGTARVAAKSLRAI